MGDDLSMASKVVGKKRKKYVKLPVHVVENHNEILPHVHRAIGAGYLPFKDVAMVHLDSHPDMLISHELQAKDSFDKEKLYEGTSIENWLMPLVFAGHIDRLAWIKPPWADQMSDGTLDFTVGRCKESEKISELLWAPERDLLDSKKLQFVVKTVGFQGDTNDIAVDVTNDELVEVLCKKSKSDDPSESKVKDASQLLTNLNETNFILDIDLDFFSTMNPFKSTYTKEQYNLMKKLYEFDIPASKNEEDLQKCINVRKKQLGQLKKAFDALACDEVPDTTDLDELFHKLVNSLKSQPMGDRLDKSAGDETSGKIDWKWVHEAGCTCDDTELPHHVSDAKTISRLMTNVKRMLKCLPKPTIVTISRSSEDDYCPKDQVDDIQSQVVAMLSELYGILDVKSHYMEGE